jgi:hypothetical protein
MTLMFVGLLILVAVMMVSRWFVAASPASVLRGAKWTGGIVLVGAALLLVVTGRVGWALAALAGLIPWLVRLFQLSHVFRLLRSGFRRGGGANASSGGGSRVETRFLHMTLDHDSGVLSGEVVDGPLAGRPLSQLSFEEALALHRFCAADPQSAQLLEAWLDRIWPDWREAADPHVAGPRESGPMSRQEACAILGVAPDAGLDAIKEAHHRLMVRLHPDHGGSNYLAAKINQAKDLLLKG